MIGLILMGLGVVLLCAAFFCLNADIDRYFFNFVVGGLCFMFVGYLSLVVENGRLGRKMMQECVQNGGEWVRYSEHGFACVGDEK